MSLELTEVQREAVRRGEAVRLSDRDLGEVVVQDAAAYEEVLRDEREKAGWAQLGRKSADCWGRENPFDL